MILGITGKAGSGKDTVADILVRDHHFTKVSFADPMKRICRDVFEFTDAQLWGPSEMRNAPDERYPRDRKYPGGGFSIGQGFLTPRLALQTLGTEFGRFCYENVWVDYALRLASLLENSPTSLDYTAREGAFPFRGNVGHLFPRAGVVIPDVRFPNEVDAIEKAGGRVVRIVRPGAGLAGSAAHHVSETALDGVAIPYIHNGGTLDDLRVSVGAWLLRPT
jgi:hypothetical protein